MASEEEIIRHMGVLAARLDRQGEALRSVIQIAAKLREQRRVIAADHSDEDGRLNPTDPDLADALRAMGDAADALLQLVARLHGD